MAAFVGFTLPSAILLIAFALLVPNLNHELGLTAIHGLKIVACAVVADAVLGMAKKLCPDTQRKAMAIGAAALILVTTSPWIQLMVVVMGGVIGSLLYKQSNTNTSPKSIAPGYGKHVPLISFSLFIALLLGLGIFSHTHIFTSIAHAFYQPGALVFGGGHVVLPLLEESTVATGWVSTESFLAGYGASQAIPGPLFTFAAYLGTVIPTGYAPWVGAIIALLFIFLPGFLLVIAALPLWETVNRNAWMANAVTGVNAAVVGLLAAALYDPIITSGIQTNIDMAIGLVAFGLLVVAKLSPLWVVAWCVFSSMMFSLI